MAPPIAKGRIYGAANELKQRQEVKDVFAAMKKIKIDLEKYVSLITEVQTRPLAPGFNFFSENSSDLLIAAKKSLGVNDQQPKKLQPLKVCKKDDDGFRYDRNLWENGRVPNHKSGLAQDNLHTAGGRFVASNSKGVSFRQIGLPGSKALHLIVGLNGNCNAHLDTHGFVVGHDGHKSLMDLNAMLEHGYFDLGPDFVPGAYVTWGDHGWMAPMVKPEKDIDGNTKFVVGFYGRF